MRSLTLLGLGWALIAAPSLVDAAEPITTADLLKQMTDLERLVEFPEPAYDCLQFSSYDRASDNPENTETWFANADAGKYLRIEERDGRQEHVMVDCEGPGAIVRIWSANPNGTLRFYFDGHDEPAWTIPMTELLGGKFDKAPSPLTGVRAAGWNSYVPLPFAKHCKITCDAGGFYYIVNYRQYEDGTAVETFEPAQLDALADEIKQVGAALAEPGPNRAADADWSELPVRQVAPGKSVELWSHKAAAQTRGGMVVALTASLDAEDRDRALRQTVLELEFDGVTTVAVPLGDFFGTAPGVNPYASLPLGMTEDGLMWSNWRMPYRQQAKLRLRNLGDQPVTLKAGVAVAPYRWTPRSMYFHVGFKSGFDVPTRPMIDMTYVDLKGQGVYVGSSFHIGNPVKQWWGEGDEKVYIDGAKFPQWFGTGTEDYYGYAWCSPELFTHAYHNQPRCDGPGNYGETSVNRWHIMDAIPYQQSLKFDMELWHWADVKVHTATTTYWYAMPGGESDHQPLTANDVAWNPIPEYQAPKVTGAIEGEEMRVIEKTADCGRQYINNCSGERHMWWHGDVKVGDVLKLGFEVESAGTYRVLGRFVAAPDYGIFRIGIGNDAGRVLGFYAQKVVVSEEIDLGVHDLAAGENIIHAELLGANVSASNGRLFGLDYVRLEAED